MRHRWRKSNDGLDVAHVHRAHLAGAAALAFGALTFASHTARANEHTEPDVEYTLERPPDTVRPQKWRDPAKRDPGEMVLLYLTLMEWTASAPAFVDAMAQNGNAYASANAASYLLPLLTVGVGAGLAAGIDIAFDHRRAVPTIISTSMLLGLGEGIAWNEYFSNRTSNSFHTYTKDMAWIFGGPAVGLATGLVLAKFVNTTPGRAAWVATTGIFGGVLAASIAGAASRPAGYPTPAFDDEGRRNVGIAAALGGIAGTAGGIATATLLSPNALRAYLIDSGFIIGTIIPGLACAKCSAPDAFAAMAVGSAIGFAGTLIATWWMPQGHLSTTKPEVSIAPFAFPTNGGFQLGVGGPF